MHLMLESSGTRPCQFSVRHPGGGALSGCVSLLRTPALALAVPRVPEESQQPGCSLALLWGRQNSVYSHSKQIPRCGLPSCHVFPHEIPDLVCCVFLKAHPLPPKTSAGEGETFLVELPVFEPVSDYAPPFVARIHHSFYQQPF